MPNYSRKSQSYKKSKNSKISGRRRKHTTRKYRRGKKVMRGGGFKSLQYPSELTNLFESRPELLKKLKEAIYPRYETLDNFFYKLKGNYKSLGLTTIAEENESLLQNPEYKDVRDFLIQKSNE